MAKALIVWFMWFNSALNAPTTMDDIFRFPVAHGMFYNNMRSAALYDLLGTVTWRLEDISIRYDDRLRLKELALEVERQASAYNALEHAADMRLSLWMRLSYLEDLRGQLGSVNYVLGIMP